MEGVIQEVEVVDRREEKGRMSWNLVDQIRKLLLTNFEWFPSLFVTNCNIRLNKEWRWEVKEIILPWNVKLLFVDSENYNMSLVEQYWKYIAVHISSKEWLNVRKEFNFFEKGNPYFEWVLADDSKNPKSIFNKLVVNWRAYALEMWKVEEVLKYFLPDWVLKWTKDAWYLFWENIGIYFEEFLKLNPKWDFLWEPTIYMIWNELIVATWDYNFELDWQNWERIVKSAQYLFVIQRFKGWKHNWRWWIKLLHSSFKV